MLEIDKLRNASRGVGLRAGPGRGRAVRRATGAQRDRVVAFIFASHRRLHAARTARSGVPQKLTRLLLHSVPRDVPSDSRYECVKNPCNACTVPPDEAPLATLGPYSGIYRPKARVLSNSCYKLAFAVSYVT